MREDQVKDVHELVDAVYRTESRQVLATLIRLLGETLRLPRRRCTMRSPSPGTVGSEWRTDQSTGLARVDRPLQGNRQQEPERRFLEQRLSERPPQMTIPGRLWADMSAIRFNAWLIDNISYSMVLPSSLVILFQG